MEHSDEQSKLRRYILNDIDGDERSEIEERLLADDEYFEGVLIAEESLIQDYADDRLDARDRERFEKHFLSSEENRRKLRFARALRKYVNESETAPDAKKKPGFFESLKAFFSAPAGIGLAVLLIAAVIGFIIWKNAAQSSETLTALNRFQKNSRPTEARITGFDYAPKIEGTRGGSSSKEENVDLLAAKLGATKAARENESAASLHELGLVFLAENNYEEAIRQFEKALKKNPNIAKIHNDLGVALLEQGRLKKDEKLELLARANAELEKAVELDKNLTEAYFNRALTVELMNLPNQAKEAWENYLKLDSSSQWANEAREHLQKLNTEKPVSKNKEEVLQDFLQAKQIGDHEKAWKTLSRNREIITGKLIPQQLTFLFLNNKVSGNEAEAQKLLDALKFAGRLEEEKAGDFFWRDVAEYYSKVSPADAVTLKEAHDLLNNGLKSGLEADLSRAISNFESASKLFLQTGNVWQRQISENYIANYLEYIDKKTDETERARLDITNRILGFSKERNYKWLEMLAMMRITSIRTAAAQYSSAISNAEKSLLIAKNSEDSYSEQRILGVLASLHSQLGNKKKAIDYTQKVFEKMAEGDTSLRQQSRNYFNAAELFVSVRNYPVAGLFVKEELLIAEQLNQPGDLSTSQTHAGKILAMVKNFSEARELLNKGMETAQKLKPEKLRKVMVAYALLKLADVEQELGNHEEAARLYAQSSSVNDTLYFRFEIQKGRLRSFLALGNDAELEQQIPQTIRTAEENRRQILEEEQSNIFFHNESSVYDTAIEWEFGRGNFQQSYDYAEGASARSLLNLLNSNDNASGENVSSLINATPLKLTDIQAQMPAETQILQYTVLDRKVLLWLVTKDKFVVKQLPVSAEDLQTKTERFINLIIENKKDVPPEMTQLSRELFTVLIEPIYSELDKEKQICLIPSRVLFFLPFSALLSAAEKPLLEEFVVFYAPSANIFLHCAKNAAEKEAETVEQILSVGNPSFDTAAFPELANLEFAETEANNIAQLYDRPARVLLTKTATKRAFRENLGSANVLHFAGHYVARPELPFLSTLLFAKDGTEPEHSTLTNAELSAENLRRYKLVVLSSCETGVESYLNGEGMIGLSRTFLATGVPLVVASQWKVDSEATAQLMEEFHRVRREQKLPTAAALRKAQLEMMSEGKFKTPYYWSAFATFGGYSKF